MNISVIIATYNRYDMLDELLGKLKRQTLPCEIVVADDGSPEPRARGDRYLWRKDDGYHKAWMLNRAVQMASGDVLVFMDDDMHPRSRLWLQSHLKALQQGDISRGPFYVGCRVDGQFRQVSPYMFGMPGTFWSCSNTAMAREAWDKVGGFDERFDGEYGFEDVDFGLRVYQAGLRPVKAAQTSTAEHIGDLHCQVDTTFDHEKLARNRTILEEKWGQHVKILMKKSGGGA